MTIISRKKLDSLILSVRLDSIDKICNPVIFAVQQADHLVFKKIAKLIPTHLTPRELLLRRGLSNIKEWSVISIAFPFRAEIVKELADAIDLPPKSWLNAKMVLTQSMLPYYTMLSSKYAALNIDTFIAPGKGLLKNRINNKNSAYENAWSERHIAYGCGLGTFGLNGALITEKGSTHRLMSILVNVNCDQYEMVNENPFGYCLWFKKGTCAKCVSRCPAGALDGKKRDSMLCREQALVKNRERSLSQYGLDVSGCALCMSKVPCSLRSPILKHSHPIGNNKIKKRDGSQLLLSNQTN